LGAPVLTRIDGHIIGLPWIAAMIEGQGDVFRGARLGQRSGGYIAPAILG